ncbi:GNAT family N-acetyltransferase [Oceanobacillus jeddahense]|uniref:GNAT family N-acetyltransferase n=1 Tax=Oceanobacillus jeddahense TaxID=1462527 RepID=UPI001FCC2DBC|nr:GNAT family N-acetyltransferase [Oceanobacillus jeddahense]
MEGYMVTQGVNSLQIRKAGEEDIKSIAKVYVDGWKTTYDGLVPDNYLESLTYEEAKQKWISFLSSEKDPFIYIADNNEEGNIGFAAGKRLDNDKFDGELYALYLLPECRGLGTGRQLVSAIAKHFIEKNMDSMMVWVMEQNKSGLGFYERMGGKKYLRRKSEFGGIVVEDAAYGWEDVSVLCREK